VNRKNRRHLRTVTGSPHTAGPLPSVTHTAQQTRGDNPQDFSCATPRSKQLPSHTYGLGCPMWKNTIPSVKSLWQGLAEGAFYSLILWRRGTNCGDRIYETHNPYLLRRIKKSQQTGFIVIKRQGRQQTHNSEETAKIRQTSSIMCTKCLGHGRSLDIPATRSEQSVRGIATADNS
jgi:hypothetical protein